MADRGLATSVYLALKLRRPLLLEGEAGVGKTEVAKVLAAGTVDRERASREVFSEQFLIKDPDVNYLVIFQDL